MFRKPARTRRGHWIEQLEVRRLLTVSWVNSGGGSWSTGSNWSTGAAPQSGDDVLIRTSSINPHITISGNVTVNSIEMNSVTLEVAGGTLTTTGAIANNSGTFIVDSGSQVNTLGYDGNINAVLTMPGGGSLTDPTSNQLVNSDFEAPAITTSTTTAPGNWPHWGSSYLSNQYAFSGVQSLRASGPNSGVLQSFPVVPGASYTLSALAMTPASDPLTGSEAAYLQLIFYDAVGNQLSSYTAPNAVTVLTAGSATGGPISGSVGGLGWNHFSTTAVAPANAATVNAALETGAYNGSGTGAGSVYWDAPQFGPATAGPSRIAASYLDNSGVITVGPANVITASASIFTTAASTLDIQLGGAPSTGAYGLITSAGPATLGGAIQADLINGYVPSTTDTFVPMQFSRAVGSLRQNLPSGPGYRLAAAQTFTNVTLSGAPTAPLVATVNASAPLHAATPNLLGVNLAWWDSALTTAQTQQLVQAAGLQTFRFPGGSSSDDYHFNSAAPYVGYETIPQFAQFIQNVNGSGMLTIDYGSGSPQEAAAELAYLEGSPTDTTTIGTGIEWNDSTSAWQNVNWQTVGYWASLRAATPLGTNDGLNFLRINHAAPFSQNKYWEVGNEEYGDWEIDHHGTAGPSGVSTGTMRDPATYANFAKQFATYAAEITATAGLPAVQIGIDSGDPSSSWTAGVLSSGAAIGFIPSYISDHSYMQGPGSENDAFLLNGTVTNPASIDDWSTRYAAYQTLLQNTVGANASSVKLMATEFNSVYTNPGKQSTSLVNGLFIANSIGSLLNSGYVGGYVWDLRNGFDSSSDQNASESLYGWRTGGDYGLLGDPGQNLPPSTGAYIAYPNYYAEQLAAQLVQGGGQVVSASGNYSELNSYAVLEANGHLRLMVVNSNPAAALTQQFNLQGFLPSGQAQVWQYGVAQDTAQSLSSTGASSLANFSTTVTLGGAGFSYLFPGYSMTVIDLTPAASVITGNGAISLVRDADQQHIDWKFAGTTGQVLITATAGLTINGNNTITLDYTNGNPLPNVLHLNGTFTINNLASTAAGANPLAGTNLEIGRSTVFINYASGTDPIAAIQSYLKNGFNAGAWTGTPTATTGVISSEAAAASASKSTAIGYADSADGRIAGQSANTIELMYTLYGDTGFAGTVGFNDFTRMTQHYTSTAGQWDTGDFNYDGTVDVNDFNLLKPVYGQTLASQPAPVVAPTIAVAPAPAESTAPTKKKATKAKLVVTTSVTPKGDSKTSTKVVKHRKK